jgi:hypothetical protein
MDVVSHGEVWPRLTILVTELVNIKELVALAALFECCNTARRKIQGLRGHF